MLFGAALLGDGAAVILSVIAFFQVQKQAQLVNITAGQVRQQAELTKLTLGVESLRHLNADWESYRMVKQRRAAAAALLQGKPTPEVHPILDFFEKLSFLVDDGTLGEEIAWHHFCVPMISYWSASREYVQHIRKVQDDPTMWEGLDALASRLMALDARHRKRPAKLPEKEVTDAFLRYEAGP